jgi:hypothetical protein
MIRAQPRFAVPRTMVLGFALCLSLGSAQAARADVIDFTGNVANDFPSSPGTTSIPGKPGSVAEASYIIQNGWTSGFLVESLRLSYDKATDTLFVGVQTYSIAGDADGNPNPNAPDPQLRAAGGVNLPGFGGDKSLTVAFASVGQNGAVGATDFVAGIPANKAVGDSRNTNDFTVATYNNTGQGLAYSYGTILNNHVGQLMVNPTPSAPNFEFALTNFSQLPGFNAAKGFYISLFMGSQAAIVVGKESLDWTLIPGTTSGPGGITANGGPITPPQPGPAQPAAVPEPASLVLFFVGAAAVVGISRRRGRPS